MQSMYSTVPAEWATGHSLGKSYPSAEKQAVGVFYSPSWVGHRTLVGEVLPLCREASSWCIRQPQLSGPQDTRWGSLTHLQRCSRCILQSQLSGPQDTRWGSLTPLQRCSRYILQPQSSGQNVSMNCISAVIVSLGFFCCFSFVGTVLVKLKVFFLLCLMLEYIDLTSIFTRITSYVIVLISLILRRNSAVSRM